MVEKCFFFFSVAKISPGDSYTGGSIFIQLPPTRFQLPSRKLTYPPKNGIFEDDFPFPQVGYVNSLEGISDKYPMGCGTPWI